MSGLVQSNKAAVTVFRIGISQNYVGGQLLKRLFCSYIQGQSTESKVREYFYYVDHQGMLFMDDARIKNFTSCFKDHKFLIFFFSRLCKNETGRYEKDFPYMSLCGRERNFLRCDDFPTVFTHVVNYTDGDLKLCYGYAGNKMSVPFEPQKIAISPTSGRVYHPGLERLGGVGLIRSALAIEFSKHFTFSDPDNKSPTHFTWNNITYELVKWCDEGKLDSGQLKISSTA